MSTCMVSHCNSVQDMLRQSISHPKWWRVLITQRKVDEKSSAKKYNSFGVNIWQKSLVHQEGISRIILWKL